MPVNPALDRLLSVNGVALDPNDAVRIATTLRPEAWDPERFDQILAALFALTSPADGGTTFGEIRATLAAQKDVLHAAFTAVEGSREARKTELGPFTGTVSYGCIELAGSDFLAKVRSPFAAAQISCGGSS